MLTWARRGGLAIVSLWFMVGGVAHFTATDFFLWITPPWVPFPLAVVYVSGVIEVLLALAILYRPWRSAGGWGLIALTLAVTPANIHMLVNADQFAEIPVINLQIRLVVQVFLLALIWWSTRPTREDGDRRPPVTS